MAVGLRMWQLTSSWVSDERERHKYRQVGKKGRKEGGRRGREEKEEKPRPPSLSEVHQPHYGWSHSSAETARSKQVRVCMPEAGLPGGHLKAATSHPTHEDTENLKGLGGSCKTTQPIDDDRDLNSRLCNSNIYVLARAGLSLPIC